MPKSRIYPPRTESNQPRVRELTDESDEEALNVYSSLDSFEESDNDIKSIILEQMRKYRGVFVKIKHNQSSNTRYAVFKFNNSELLNHFKRAILEKRHRIIVYDKILFFNFNRRNSNTSYNFERKSNVRQREYSNDDESSTNNDRYGNKQDRRKSFTHTVTRTLFVGNLDETIDSNDITKTFEPYGKLMEVVVKHPTGPNSAPYAFVKFSHLKDAVNARDQLQDTLISKRRITIGYGRLSPSHALWIGFTDNTIEDELIEEMKKRTRFVSHKFIKEELIAYFVFETIEDCRRAFESIKGINLPVSGAKLDLDFADTHTEARELMDSIRDHSSRRLSVSSNESNRRDRSKSRDRFRSPIKDKSTTNRKRCASSETSDFSSRYPAKRRNRSISPTNTHRTPKESPDSRNNLDARKRMTSCSPESSNHSLKVKSRVFSQKKEISRENSSLQTYTKITTATTSLHYLIDSPFNQIINAYPVVWKGGFTVKSNVYHLQLHLVCGSVDTVSSMVHQATLEGRDATKIHLTQRFTLLPDQVMELRAKLARAICSRDCSVLISQPATGDSREETTSKPMSSLISYFQEKQSAGITNEHGVSIYAFPPSPFTQEQLSTLMPHAAISLSGLQDGYLMVIISR